MKVLIITGLHPTESNRMSGVFITRRIKKLQEHGIDCDVYSFFVEDSWILEPIKKLYRILLKIPPKKFKSNISIDGVIYKFIPIKLNVIDRLLYHQRIGEKMADCITNSLDLSKYDLIHGHWVYPHGYAVTLIKKQTGLPCIVSAHGSDIHTVPYTSPKTIYSVLYTLKNANIVFFNNNNLLNAAEKLGYDGENYNILPNGVDTTLFHPMNKDRVRSDLGLPSPTSKQIVGFIGNLKHIKGADRLVEIFKHILNKENTIEFVVIGDGEFKKEIKKGAEGYGLNVGLMGRIDPEKIPLWMNAIDVLVLPSRQEGCPNVILEAQSCGCPVVGSNVGGIPQAIGKGGIVVDEGSNFEENFANAVLSMLNNPPPIEQMRERVVQFDWDMIIEKQINMYRSLIQC